MTLVVRNATVQEVLGPVRGRALHADDAPIQVVVAVPADRAADVLTSIGGRPLVVVVHDSVDTGSEDGVAEVPRPAAATPPAAAGPTG